MTLPLYSLKKSKRLLRHVFHQFLKKKKKLTEGARKTLEQHLLALQDAVMRKDRGEASLCAHELNALAAIHLKKSPFEQARELVFALGFALIIAVLVRQMWFEFYEIPSGSMRPTFKEQDRLLVSKTDFGVNIPLRPAQFYFDPALVKRSGIVIFTGENMPISDVDTTYFYLFPGKKQYIKRMIGKPGDILYFYGGKIYGIDAEGRDISAELQLPELSYVEHIPFLGFDRKWVTPPGPGKEGIYSPAYLYQMNEAVAKLSVGPGRLIQGEMLNPPQIHASTAPGCTTLGNLWGFKNFGMGRLFTPEQAKQLPGITATSLPPAELYLEITHNPSLKKAYLTQDYTGKVRPTIGTSTTLLPLQKHHLEALLAHMYTARFEVKEGKGYRMGNHSAKAAFYAPKLPGVPDGCYEFYEGQAYKIGWQGVSTKLPSSHPLYTYSPTYVQELYNMGIEWDTRFSPRLKEPSLSPARYVYFREGALYLLGAPILEKEDPTLITFLEQERLREAQAPQGNPYPAFQDYGPPLTSEGVINRELIRQNGILVPPDSYLVLGDNHAMSGDSREFGFVPSSNLRGAPDFIFWPPGPRFGVPTQPSYPWITLPSLIVWIAAAIGGGMGYLYWNKKNRLPLKIKESEPG